MGPPDEIDVTFDFRRDTPDGKDPDDRSPTLRRYHLLLWNKPLPSGVPFELDVTTPGTYLSLRTALGDFGLSSDTIIHSYSQWPRMREIIDQIPSEETEEFMRVGSTIGSRIVFPGFRVDGKMTINQRRGCHPRIWDRFDLTLECIRRHYLGEPSPLDETLARNADFFSLYRDFRGYVEFFLLRDLVNMTDLTPRFFLPFNDFTASPLPATLDEYVIYRRRSTEFVDARNRRMAAAVEARG